MKEYVKSDKYKAYIGSDKYKERRNEYTGSDKYKERRNEYMKEYAKSDKHKAYMKSERGKNTQTEKYVKRKLPNASPIVIEIKKIQLKLKRTIKTKTNEINSNGINGHSNNPTT
jgi:hypothetical protein